MFFLHAEFIQYLKHKQSKQERYYRGNIFYLTTQS